MAIEKNLESFLGAAVAGTKVVVGDGPALAQLKLKFPDAVFTGSLTGTDLAQAYAAADVFVFPSKTDTFGLVMIEALACGVPVAGYPVPGPLDIIGSDGLGPFGELANAVGATSHSLSQAITAALGCDQKAAAAYGAKFTWANAVDQFLAAVEGARMDDLKAA